MTVAAPAPIVETARAKLNLMLHVVGRRADGYHLLESLFAFTRFGDVLTIEAADSLSLTIQGPFAPTLATSADDNLVVRAARRLAEAAGLPAAGAAIRLEKRIPVAAGLGGGSADAAATLRGLNRLWGLGWSPERLAALAAALGADVPACVHSRPMWGTGVGDILRPARLAWSSLPVLLANPRWPLATPGVFKAFREAALPFSAPLAGAEAAVTVAALAGWRNDLEAAASLCAPEVMALGRALAHQPGVRLARMAGSGPSWFAVFESGDDMARACDALGATHPGWWLQPSEIKGCASTGVEE
jgi:4-diphosphocytidyl-2-C-methyl-D-erythritol kinase